MIQVVNQKGFGPENNILFNNFKSNMFKYNIYSRKNTIITKFELLLPIVIII